MPRSPWQKTYADKLVSAGEAVSCIRSGQTVYIGSGAAEPTSFTQTLVEMAPRFSDVGIIHLLSASEESILARPELSNSFRYNSFYSGRGVSAIVAQGAADYTPMAVSDLPRAMEIGVIRIDVALIQVAPPDEFGLCSLGVSVDATKAAVEHANVVLAQVNDKMPVTLGDSLIPVDSLHLLTEGSAPLPEVPADELDPVASSIGRHIAGLIVDGATLHFDRGPISAATMRYLDTKKDLGIHTDILTDDIMRLIRSRAVTNRKKKVSLGKSVATMVIGSTELYEAVNANPYIELLPIDQVNDPFVISSNDNMVSVHAVHEVELTGLARAETEVVSEIRNLPSSMDFVEGAARSDGGFSILALPSTTRDGRQSRIVALSISRGAAFSRHKINYVVTEYGVANMTGRSIRERAISLISIAHPKFRADLLEEAKRFNYLPEGTVISPESGGVYPHQYEFQHTFGDTEVLFRPMRPCDARRMQRLFYSLSPEGVRLRYHGSIKAMTNEMVQKISAVDYSRDMPIVGLVGPRHNPEMIAEGRYMYNPANNMGEFDIVVRDDYRGKGIAVFLADYLKKIAYSRGLSGVYAEVIQQNRATMALLDKAWPTATKTFDSGSCTYTVRFPEADIARPKDSIFIYSGQFSDYTYGEDHPFNPGRARDALRLVRLEGFLNEPWIRTEEPRPIARERLIESHSPAYVAALEEANSGAWNEEFLQFNLGGDDCRIFPGLFDYIMLYTSATLTGVDLIMEENANIVFNPLGGFHHSSRSHAEGFCYVNDVIVAIDLLLSRGFRVAYVDIDAHHGNGVQDAYYRDDRVLTVSLHQTGKTLYPWGGFETEIGEERGKGYNVNVPLPEETDDEAYITVFDRVVTPAVSAFEPTVVVAVIGTDTHRSDPLANLSLTNNGMVSAMERIRDYCNHLLLLGGGGYDLKSVTRGWCRMWAEANRIDALPDYLLTLGGSFVGSEGLQGGEIVDMRYRVSGSKKAAITAELDRIAEFHETQTIPRIARRTAKELGELTQELETGEHDDE